MPMVLPWDCDFGLNITDADVCGFEQDLSDDFDWTPNICATPSKFTGPPEDSFEAHRENKSYLRSKNHFYFC